MRHYPSVIVEFVRTTGVLCISSHVIAVGLLPVGSDISPTWQSPAQV